MTEIITFRVPSSMRAALVERLARLGRTESEHLRQLVAADLAGSPKRGHRFSSMDLAGIVSLGPDASSNASVRAALRRRKHRS